MALRPNALVLPTLHLLPSELQESLVGSVDWHVGILSMAEHIGSLDAAFWRRVCCCWEMITVRGIAAKIRKSTITAVVRE